VAFEIMRRKLDGAINFTASHKPCAIHGLKFSSADAGPRHCGSHQGQSKRGLAELDAKGRCSAATARRLERGRPKVNLRENLFGSASKNSSISTPLAKAKPSLVVDALHCCGAGYLDHILARWSFPTRHAPPIAIAFRRHRSRRSPKRSWQPLANPYSIRKPTVGLATDGDADRFGIVDRDGTWIQPI